ncbi:MAG: hypothetical protein ABEJ78_10025 [Haloferacaceae archaeon]
MASEGDPRVLLAMNVVLSSIFAIVVVWGLDFVGVLPFTPRNVVGLAAVLVVLTYLVVIR